MSIRTGTCATLLAAALAASGLLSACSQPRADQAPPPTTRTPPTTTTAPSTAANPTVPSQSATEGEPACGPPALRVVSPADGSRVRAPFPLTYEVRCFPIGRDGTIYLATDGMRVDLHPREPSGVVTVPDHPLLSGRRTVTIQLANNGQSMANPEASVIIALTIEGSR